MWCFSLALDTGVRKSSRMTRIAYIAGALILSAAVLIATTRLFAQDLEPGFKSLFNGKDLTGWRYPGKTGMPMDGKTETPDSRVEVKDGAIVMKEKDSSGKGGKLH